MILIHFDWLTLILSAGAAFGFGAIWYSSAMFGPTFFDYIGKKPDSMGIALLIEYSSMLIIAIILAIVMNFFSVVDFNAGWIIAVLLVMLALLTEMTTDAIRRSDSQELWMVNLCNIVGFVMVIGSVAVLLSPLLR